MLFWNQCISSISCYPDNSGWDVLWKTYTKELCVGAITECRSSGEVIACLKSQGLKYEEHVIPNTFDITECFNPSSQTGQCLLNFFTVKDNFYQSFTPEIRAGMLDLLRNECSTEKDGRVFFNNNVSCILVYAWVCFMGSSCLHFICCHLIKSTVYLPVAKMKFTMGCSFQSL